jgi:hypothetical protein
MGALRGDRLGFSTCWAISTLVLFALMVTWSFATPLGAASDEPTQMIKAAAVARGEFLGQTATGQSVTRVGHEGRAVMTVLVPATYAEDARLPTCFRHQPKKTAACAPAPTTSGQLTAATTYVGRYPPLYYMIVGLPSRVLHSGAGMYFMRVLSALASALLLGLALAMSARWSRSRFLVGGVALAATPMVVFLGSVVNPSGLEIAASIAAWTTGLVLVMDHSSKPPVGLVVAFAVSSCVLELIRGLSPFWLLLVLVTLVALEPRGCWQLVRDGAGRIAAAVIVLTGVVATAYIVLAGATVITPSGIPLPAHATAWTVVNLYQAHITGYVTQVVGDFGWLDTPAPFLVVMVIGLTIAGLVWLAIATARRRHAAVLIGLIVASVVVPIAINVKSALQLDNDVWQSRYALPLYVGVPLVAAAIATRSKAFGPTPTRRLIVTGVWLVAGCQFVCFFAALHRYTAGVDGGLDPFAHSAGSWTPPAPTVVLLTLALVFTACYGWWIVHLDHLRSVDATDVPAGGAEPAEPAAPSPSARPVGEPTGTTVPAVPE